LPNHRATLTIRQLRKGKFRYDRFLKSVGAAMAGDSKAAMIELLNHFEKG